MLVCHFNYKTISNIFNAIKVNDEIHFRISSTSIYSIVFNTDGTVAVEWVFERSAQDTHTFDDEVSFCVAKKTMAEQLKAGRDGDVARFIYDGQGYRFCYENKSIGRSYESVCFPTIKAEEETRGFAENTPPCTMIMSSVEFKSMMAKIVTMEDPPLAGKSVQITTLMSERCVYFSSKTSAQPYKFKYDTHALDDKVKDPSNTTVRMKSDGNVDVYLSLKELLRISEAVALNPEIQIRLSEKNMNEFLFIVANERSSVLFRLAPMMAVD